MNWHRLQSCNYQKGTYEYKFVNLNGFYVGLFERREYQLAIYITKKVAKYLRQKLCSNRKKIIDRNLKENLQQYKQNEITN
jgi:hypothetical protein